MQCGTAIGATCVNQEETTRPPSHREGVGINHALPTGARLRKLEREMSTASDPMNAGCAGIWWGYNSYNGCRLGSDLRNRAHGKLEIAGIHWPRKLNCSCDED